MNRSHLWPLAALLLALAGCAGQAVHDSPGLDARAEGRTNVQARIHTELGAGYYARGQYAIALQELKIAREADPGYAPAYSILGLVHAELREDRQAEDNFRRAIDLSPGYSEGHNNYGLFLCQRGRVPESLARFEAALANPLYETPEKALANAGVCLLDKGDLAQAEIYLTRALKRAPGLTTALLGTAELHFRQGRWLAARSVLRQVGEVMDLGAQALWLGVRVERRLGDRDAEASYGAQLRRRFPESMQTQWLVTGQYEQTGSLL
jgi:type IV pilus assembly protein PilF